MWLTRLEQCKRLLSPGSDRTPLAAQQLARIAPVLLDTIHRPVLLTALQAVTAIEAERHAGLAYVSGVLAAQRGDDVEATRWLTRAWALTPDRSHALAARIGLELGLTCLARGERFACDAVLAQLETREGPVRAPSADRLLLCGQLHADAGEQGIAQGFFRDTLVQSNDALTPLTHVLGLLNLAIVLEHVLPSDSIALCKLANECITQEKLDPRWHAKAWNILGYAHVCAGNLAEAREALNRALREAEASALASYTLRARFNLAIVDELEGDLANADARLSEIEQSLSAGSANPLVTWAAIRRAWIALEQSDVSTAVQRFPALAPRARCHWEALDTLRMRFAILEGDLASGRKLLTALVPAYRERGDLQTAMTLLLWRAHLEWTGGQTVVARAFFEEAWEIGGRHGFSLATNWWSPQIVQTARLLATVPQMAAWTAALHTAVIAAGPSGEVVITSDGDVLVHGAPLPGDRWRRGGAGPRVLHRYLSLLAVAYPRRLARDDIVDTLWPQSDGDRAINNLYAATSDLRCVLRDVDGVNVVCRQGSYGLALRGNVTITTAAPNTIVELEA
jgi:Tfp pilus assembly protein PilF